MFEKLRKMIPRKVIYILVATILAGVSARYPNIPLPSADTITDWAMVLIGAHTLTDITWIVTDYLKQVAQERRAKGEQP